MKAKPEGTKNVIGVGESGMVEADGEQNFEKKKKRESKNECCYFD